jgi:hypothetical protein
LHRTIPFIVRRLLFHLVVLVSLALTLGTVVMWYRSTGTCDFWRASREGQCRYRYIISDAGRIGFYDYTYDSGIPLPGGQAPDEHWGHHKVAAPGSWQAIPFAAPDVGVWGFALGVTREHTLRGRFYSSGAAQTVEYWLPYWALAAAFAVLPVVWARQQLRRMASQRRRNEGLCPGCGYDLRGTPQRCPECGATAGMPSS